MKQTPIQMIPLPPFMVALIHRHPRQFIRTFAKGVFVLVLSLCLTSCSPRRAQHGPFEYAELSYTANQNISSRVGGYARDPSSKRAIETRFEQGDSLVVSDTYSGLMEKLGGGTTKQDCSTALLNYLDRKGWELVNHSISSVSSSMVVQDGNIGANLSESQIEKHIWTLRRAR